MFGKLNLLKVKNNTIVSYDQLLVQKRNFENIIANLQREKDLRIDRLNNRYDAQIERALRALTVVNNEIDKVQQYINLDQYIPIGVKNHDKKSSK